MGRRRVGWTRPVFVGWGGARGLGVLLMALAATFERIPVRAIHYP